MNIFDPQFKFEIVRGAGKIRLGDDSYDLNLPADLEIRSSALIPAMAAHATQFAEWSTLNAQAKAYLRQAKQMLAGSRDQTDAFYNVSVLTEIVEFTEAAVRAFEHKRDMLKEINRAQCAAFAGELN